MARFHCESCGYSVTRQEKPRRCPYCSEDAMTQESKASEILDEVD